jgi:virginiamycin B lyase
MTTCVFMLRSSPDLGLQQAHSASQFSAICRRPGRRFAAIMVAIAILAFTPQILTAQTPGISPVDITEYGGVTVAQGIAAGPDGAVWFTERTIGKIGRISMSGMISEFALSNSAAHPGVITAGPDGALWFTEILANKIGRITTDGTITEFPIPTASSSPQGITAGPDGALWFTEAAGKIGRITTAGALSEFTLPAGHDATSIANGPDGALWFVEWGANKIGRITTAGSITEFNIPTANAAAGSITTGPDGALWFVEYDANKIGRITTAGVITEYSIPTAGGNPIGITAGPDGALWFTESNTVKIGRITTAGSFAEFTLPGGTRPFFITTGPDGAVWFSEYSKIGRVRLPKTRTGVLSHVAAGGSWTTTITLVNTSGVAVPLTVALRDEGGGALTLPVQISQGGSMQNLGSVSSVDSTLQPQATLLLFLGESVAGLSVGWAEVLSPGPVCGFAIFRTVAAGQASEGTVPLQAQFPSTMVVPFENTGGFVMGIAMANLSATAATITATIWDETGTQIGSTILNPVAGNGHTSFVLHDQVSLTAGKRGIVRFQSPGTGGLAGLGLRFMNAQNTFTSVPTM